MSRIFEELLNSSPFAIIELFELELFEKIHGSSEQYCFYNGVNKKDTPGSIIFNGKDYTGIAIEADGFEFKGDGTLPRPTVRVSNIFGSMSALLLGVNVFNFGNDLNGAKFTRIRTLSRFLDAANWENGINPYGSPDPGETMPKEVYYVDRKVSENREFVEFELVSCFDLTNVRAPRRQVVSNLCQWEYRSKECGYTGPNEFTAEGVSIQSVAAPNFSHTTGADILSAGSTLQEGDTMVSSNGWFKLVVERDGALNVFIKNDPTGVPHWRVGGSSDGDNFSLVMQTDGNLVLYNDKYAKTQYPQSVVWATGTDRVGQVASVAKYVDSGSALWYPDNVRAGRAGAFTWEIAGSSPTANGQTATATKTFTENHPEFGTRSVTITFGVQSIAFDIGAFGTPYFQNNSGYTGYVWTDVVFTTLNVTGSTGKWRNGEIFAAKLNLSSGNPHRANHPTEGTLNVAGVKLKITTTGWNNKQFKLQDDGNLVVSDTDGSDIVWTAGIPATTTEPQIADNLPDSPSIEVSGICGKRISDCRLRFPNGDASGGLPFGSFPAAGGLL
jgi:lambda family phage minor tail protein L|tara:strand:+ start:215 stop:1882 length:1668 start_codon:yes stop_codon:yes gene_type:complete